MSRITLAPNASGTGTLTVAAPNTNTNQVLTLPDATTTLVGTDATQTLSNKTLTAPTLTGVASIGAGSGVYANNADMRLETATGRGWRMGTTSSASTLGYFYIQGTTDNFSASFIDSLNIDSSGNVGIGTTSPSQKLAVNGQINMPAATTEERAIEIGAGRTGNGYAYIDFIGDATYTDFGLRIMRENAGPNTNSSVTHRGTGGLFIQAIDAGYVSLQTSAIDRININSAGVVAITNLAGTGSRTVTAGATGILAAASDSRLKQEVPEAPIAGLAEIMQLRPVAYKWLDDIEKRGDDAAVELGFFADEAKDIIPSAAPMGNDGYYGFYDRAVIAALTKAIQEQQAMITALEARIAVLEAK